MNIAIVGYGFVGKATERFFKRFKHHKIFLHDPDLGHIIDDFSQMDYTIMCVPTDLGNGSLNLTVLLQAMQVAQGPIIVRSTIGVDQVKIIQNATKYSVTFWPEFLKEKTWEFDTDRSGTNFNYPLILGGDQTFKVAQDLFSEDTYVIRMTAEEASLSKMSRNAMLAAKVAQANMLYDLCKYWNADYDLVKNFLQRDGQLGSSHMNIEETDGKRGFHGKCLPKDSTHYEQLFGYDNLYTMMLEYNETL